MERGADAAGLTRRGALGASLALGGAALLPGAAAGGQAAGGITFVSPFADSVIAEMAQTSLGAAGYGAAEYGEVATALDAVRRGGETYQAVFDAFTAMGRRVTGFARQARQAGDAVGAREAELRAAKYLMVALFVALGTRQRSRAAQAAAYRAMDARWRAAATAFEPAFEPVRIPFPGGALPGWFLRPPGPVRPRPTVIVNNGNDYQNVDAYVYGGAAAIARGMNAFIFEGPGQGATWFLRRVPFRPDWERVVTRVVDLLRRRRDVAENRIGIIGWSQGAQLVARAAAFERRLAAVVLDPGAVDPARVLLSAIPANLRQAIADGAREEANALWDSIQGFIPRDTRFRTEKFLAPFGRPTFFDSVRRLEEFRVTRYIGRIRAPTLVTAYEDEDAVPGQAVEVMRLLRSEKRLVRFTAAEGAQFHCAPMAPQRRNQVVFDWLARRL